MLGIKFMENNTVKSLTDEQIEAQIDAAIARQPEIDATEPRAKNASFSKGRIYLDFANGSKFSFLTSSIDVLANLAPEILNTVELTPLGKGLRWQEPDIGISIQSILLDSFGANIWMREVAVKGGSSKSERKKTASRNNGKKGGRPRKLSN